MKGLLQSKIFKKNLGKWLFMYLLCMGLFTTVITYSKYISSLLDESDSARVSKFNIVLKYCSDATCSDATTTAPSVTTYRPFDDMIYYFAIDSSNLEVDTDLYLTLGLDRHFKVKELVEITDGVTEGTDLTNTLDVSQKTQLIERKVVAGDKNLIKYMITVVYDETVVDKKEDGTVMNGIVKDEDGITRYIFDESQEYQIVTVDYSAEQTR